jgi:hypothetical protein
VLAPHRWQVIMSGLARAFRQATTDSGRLINHLKLIVIALTNDSIAFLVSFRQAHLSFFLHRMIFARRQTVAS